MTRLVVVEARRLLPVAVLFILLLAVSIYDGLSTPAKPVISEVNTVPYRTLIQTTQSGAIRSTVATSLDTWVAIHSALGIELVDYNFDPRTEVAVFLFNCQLVSSRLNNEVVELTILPEKTNCQVVVFNKNQLPEASPQFILVEADGKRQ